MRKSAFLVSGLALLASWAWSDSVLAQSDRVQAHIDHVMTQFKGTPDDDGLLPTAFAEAEVAAQHAALAAKTPENLEAMKLHAGHVAHALDPSVEPQGPGLGYGVKRAAAGVVQHIQLAAKSEGASKNVQTHAEHVAASATNVANWSDELLEVTRKIQDASSAAEAAPLAARLDKRVQDLATGTDANGDGRVSWQPEEGGLQQAKQHMELLIRGEQSRGAPAQ